MSEEPELKECPFCGSNNIEIRVWQPSGHSIRCLNCEAQTSREFAKTLSIERWNTRHESGELPQWAIDAIEKEIFGLWEEYAKTGITRLDACARKLEWVLSLRKSEDNECEI